MSRHKACTPGVSSPNGIRSSQNTRYSLSFNHDAFYIAILNNTLLFHNASVAFTILKYNSSYISPPPQSIQQYDILTSCCISGVSVYHADRNLCATLCRRLRLSPNYWSDPWLGKADHEGGNAAVPSMLQKSSLTHDYICESGDGPNQNHPQRPICEEEPGRTYLSFLGCKK